MKDQNLIDLISRIENIKLEKMEKKKPKRYNLQEMLGLFDTEEEIDGTSEHDLIM